MSKSLLFILLVFFASQGQAAELNKFYYSGQKELSLDGEWKFYWKQLLYSDDSELENGGFKVEMPNFWNYHKEKNYKPNSFGFATYKTTIVSDSNRTIAIEYAGPHCAQRIYLNGKLIVETGTVSSSAKYHKSLWLPGTVNAKLKKGENELILQVSNFEHSKGGIYKTPIIGQRAHLNSKRKRSLFLDTLVAGGLSIIGVFFFGLSLFWRNNRLFIYFGCFTILFSFWYINYGTHAFKVAFPEINWSLSIRLTYLAFFGFSFFLSLFTFETFKHSFGKFYLRIVVIVYTILFLTVIISEPHFFTSIILYPYLVIFGQLLYVAFIFINIVRLKVKNSLLRVLLISVSTLISLLILGWFFNYLPWVSEVLGLSFLFTFLLMAVLMSRKVGGDYRSVIELRQEAIAQNKKIQEQTTKLRLLDEMKTRFFANVSHDLRSPLTLIKGSVYRIKKENDQLTESSDDDFKTIDSNVNQLIHLTDEIRDLNLLDQKEFLLSYSEIEINSFLSGILNMFQSFAATRDIQLSFGRSKEDIIARIDEKKVRRALNNLLSNAFKFTNNGGRIGLTVHEMSEGFQIQVSDSGVGINKEEQPFVFDRFYQGKENMHRSVEGMGIGLALVHEIITLHGGSVQVESELGKGSLFTVFLPYNRNQALSERMNDTKNELLPKVQIDNSTNVIPQFESKEALSEKRILLVDDHHEVRKYIASVINEQYTVIEAKNGAEAFDFLKKNKVDLVITDLMMPWMDGFELIDKMNEDVNMSRIKIMVVSARTTREDRLKVLNKGVNEFISKPFDEEEFNSRIANVLSGEESSLLTDLAEKKGKYSTIEEQVLSKVNDLILDQIDNSKLTTAVLADALATSERNASRIIKKLTGHPPKSYIQQVRMDYVELLIKDGKVKSLTEAGLAIGMKNATQFAKQFEKIKGYPPLTNKDI